VLLAGIGFWTYGLLVARQGLAPGAELVAGAVVDQVAGIVTACIGAAGLAVVLGRRARLAKPVSPAAREAAADRLVRPTKVPATIARAPRRRHTPRRARWTVTSNDHRSR
jgi:hypothetical protein